MNVLHIITGLNNGGAEAVLYRLVAAGKETGDRHSVISLMDGGVYAERLEQLGCRVDCLDMPRGRITLKGLLQLYRLVRAARPDLVQTWMYHADFLGGLAARAAGVRAIVWGVHQSNVARSGNSRLSFLLIRLCGLLSRFVPAKIACCSQKGAALHHEAGYRLDKISVIPNGYPLDEARPDPEAGLRLREELGLEAATPVIGMVARFDVLKDHGTLIRALAQLARNTPAFTCLLVGSGMSPGNSELTRMISEAGIERQTRLMGARNDIPSVMNALDVHILSSISEGFPNVLAEAMACGTPCVSTDVGDAALIVGTAGWVVPHRNPSLMADAIAAAINERYAEPESWAARQAACREHIVKNFSLERMVASYQLLWQNALAVTAVSAMHGHKNTAS